MPAILKKCIQNRNANIHINKITKIEAGYLVHHLLAMINSQKCVCSTIHYKMAFVQHISRQSKNGIAEKVTSNEQKIEKMTLSIAKNLILQIKQTSVFFIKYIQ